MASFWWGLTSFLITPFFHPLEFLTNWQHACPLLISICLNTHQYLFIVRNTVDGWWNIFNQQPMILKIIRWAVFCISKNKCMTLNMHSFSYVVFIFNLQLFNSIQSVLWFFFVILLCLFLFFHFVCFSYFSVLLWLLIN